VKASPVGLPQASSLPNSPFRWIEKAKEQLVKGTLDHLRQRLKLPSAELDIDRPEDLLSLEQVTQIKRRALSDPLSDDKAT